MRIFRALRNRLGALINSNDPPPSAETLRLPIHAMIGPTTRCNIQCRTCPAHSIALPHDASKFRDMAPEIYARVRREVLPSLKEVFLSDAGEPFLAARIETMIDDVLAVPDRRLCIPTNGMIIKRDLLTRLVNSPTAIGLSIDGATAEVLEYIRPGVRLARVIEFMETVRELAARSAHPDFQLHICNVVTRANLEQMTDLVELAHRYGVKKILFTHFETYARTDEFALTESMADRHEEVLPHWRRAHQHGLELGIEIQPIPRVPTMNSVAAAEPPGKCWVPWLSTSIEADGAVKACCRFEPFGNLRERSFREIWESAPYQELRLTVNTPNRPKPCRYCPAPYSGSAE